MKAIRANEGQAATTAFEGRTFARIFPITRRSGLHLFEHGKMNWQRYRIEHWEHDTASQCRIYALLPDDELLVYREDAWVGGYEHHLRDTIQGYQHDGPWVDELEEYRKQLNAAIDAEIERKKTEKLQHLSVTDQSEAAKLSRFAREFSK